ncbi:MAG TPA: ABC transporter permease [Protaetiibacter sp.]|nr:ABC transporter permease [Protaetiibacter sp.]
MTEIAGSDVTSTRDSAEHPAPIEEPSLAELEVESLELQLSEESESFGRQAWRAFRSNRLAIIGAVVLVVLILLAIFGPSMRPYAFDERNVLARRQGPSAEHWFGTDNIGRDLFVRATRGARTSLFISFLTAALAVSFGTLLGAMAGYFGRTVDVVVSFLTNLFLTIPLYAILLVFGKKYGAEAVSISIVISLFIWTRAARIVRSQFLTLSQQEFVQAARAAGARGRRIIFRHILPHSIGPIAVEITLTAGLAIILESTLSFLSLGIVPPETSLGVLVADAKGQFTAQPSAVLIPGAMITAIILSLNFMGDGLRDAFDPQASSRN